MVMPAEGHTAEKCINGSMVYGSKLMLVAQATANGGLFCINNDTRSCIYTVCHSSDQIMVYSLELGVIEFA